MPNSPFIRRILLLSLLGVWAGCGCGASARRLVGGRVEPVQTPVAPSREAPPPQAPAMSNAVERTRSVGTNLATPSYWSRSQPFVNFMHHADKWVAGSATQWEDGRALDTDSQGWIRRLAPGQIAHVFMLAGEGPYPTGRYTVMYDGNGRLEYKGRISNVTQRPGQDVFDVGPNDGFYIDVVEVDERNPIRNLRVFPPGGSCEESEFKFCRTDRDCDSRCVPFTENYEQRPFHPTFLSEMAPFSVLRFMDWQNTNRERIVPDNEEGPSPRAATDLPTRASAFWHPVPIDIMVDLANRLDASPWFCMPTLANDDLVRHFAEVVHSELEPGRQVYVEYSNEYWNDMFDQHQWINRIGCERFSSNAQRECRTGRDICSYTEWNATQEKCVGFGRRQFAERSVEVGRIWRTVHSDRASDVVRVMAAQIGGGDWWLTDYLQRNVGGQPAYRQIDAVAVAPYFGGDAQGPADVWAQVPARQGSGQVDRVLYGAPDAEWGGLYDWIQTDLRAINTLASPVRYIAYEGGQHLHNHDQNIMRHFHEVNRDPRMEGLYGRYLALWGQLTNDALFVHFTSPTGFGNHGAWGVKEYQGQSESEAPKYRALLTHIRGSR